MEKQAMVSKIVSLLQGWKLGFQNRTQSPRRDPCVYGTEVAQVSGQDKTTHSDAAVTDWLSRSQKLRFLPYSILKNEFQISERPNYEKQNLNHF